MMKASYDHHVHVKVNLGSDAYHPHVHALKQWNLLRSNVKPYEIVVEPGLHFLTSLPNNCCKCTNWRTNDACVATCGMGNVINRPTDSKWYLRSCADQTSYCPASDYNGGCSGEQRSASALTGGRRLQSR